MALVRRRLGDKSPFETSWGVALWAIAIAAILHVLDFAAAIILPTIYAIVLSLVLAPIARALSRIGLGDGIAAIITVFMAAAAIVAVITVVMPSVRDWIANAPKMERQIETKLKPIREQLQSLEAAQNRLSGDNASKSVAAGSGTNWSAVFLSVGTNIVSQTIYVLFLILFFLSLRTDLRRRFILTSDTVSGRLRMARAVRDVGKNVAAYLFVLTCINIGVAVVTATAFYVAGIADPLVWGCIYGLANYIPVIGPTGTIVAAGLTGVATSPTLIGGLAGSAIMLAINAVESQFVQPWLMARRIEINPIALFICLAFVVFLWGVGAAIISAPMLITIYTFSKHTPALEPIAAVLAPPAKVRRDLVATTPRIYLRLRRKSRLAAAAAPAPNTPSPLPTDASRAA